MRHKTCSKLKKFSLCAENQSFVRVYRGITRHTESEAGTAVSELLGQLDLTCRAKSGNSKKNHLGTFKGNTTMTPSTG